MCLTEIKKLVYMFLIYYSEDNEELALLCINTLQKDLTANSQRTRANAMRAMSSLRVPVVVPLVMLALKTAVKDPSAYVRKAAAAAIPKLYRMDNGCADELVPLIETMLTSTEPEVLSSTIFAFHEVCPDRNDLLHQHFRKICHLLADFTEWGQVLVLKVLTRYARLQFRSPFIDHEAKEGKKPPKPKKKKKFYSDAESDSNSDASSSSSEEDEQSSLDLDPDHALLLKQGGQLIQSRNSGVIMALVTLFFNLAPKDDCPRIIKPLMRMIRNRREISYVLLANVSTMAAQRPALFRSFIQDFFVASSDPRYIRDLKLDVLASVAAESNISGILKEFEAYMRDGDKQFVAHVVEALSRCAQQLPEIADRCMELLLKLTASPNKAVVAQSVVAVRQLLQCDPEAHSGVVKKIAKLVDDVEIPVARASIVWMIGEFRDSIPTRAPDCLRKLAKTFSDEDGVVKLQILNLAVKLFLSNPQQTARLFRYIMDLAKYDVNYDLRDRARLIKALFFKRKKKKNRSGEAKAESLDPEGTEVKEQLKIFLLSEKPIPALVLPYAERNNYTLGSLSHVVSQPVRGYENLPDFPEEAPDVDRSPVTFRSGGRRYVRMMVVRRVG